MKQPPYSLQEAEKLCNDFRHIAGRPFEPDCDAPIDCVAIAPYDQASKNRFTIFYLLFDDAGMALNHEYKGLLYDVIVIAGSSEQGQLRSKDLYQWLDENNMLAGMHGQQAHAMM